MNLLHTNELCIPSKTKVSKSMKQLLEDELNKVILWLDQFELSKLRKVLSRDFSDAGKKIIYYIVEPHAKIRQQFF